MVKFHFKFELLFGAEGITSFYRRTEGASQEAPSHLLHVQVFYT